MNESGSPRGCSTPSGCPPPRLPWGRPGHDDRGAFRGPGAEGAFGLGLVERALPPEWLTYAALDVELLIEFRDRLADRTARGRQGRVGPGEFAALVAGIGHPGRTSPGSWRRTSGIHGSAIAAVWRMWRNSGTRETPWLPLGWIVPRVRILPECRDQRSGGFRPSTGACRPGQLCGAFPDSSAVRPCQFDGRLGLRPSAGPPPDQRPICRFCICPPKGRRRPGSGRPRTPIAPAARLGPGPGGARRDLHRGQRPRREPADSGLCAADRVAAAGANQRGVGGTPRWGLSAPGRGSETDRPGADSGPVRPRRRLTLGADLTTSTGTSASRISVWVTLPSRAFPTGDRRRAPMTSSPAPALSVGSRGCRPRRAARWRDGAATAGSVAPTSARAAVDLVGRGCAGRRPRGRGRATRPRAGPRGPYPAAAPLGAASCNAMVSGAR